MRTFSYIGCSMDTPELLDYVSLSRETDSPSESYLQLNGLAQRSGAEAESFMASIAGAGIKSVDLTFYGMREYHDRFAGRRGDFDLLLRLLKAASGAGIGTHVTAGHPGEHGLYGAAAGVSGRAGDTRVFCLPAPLQGQGSGPGTPEAHPGRV